MASGVGVCDMGVCVRQCELECSNCVSVAKLNGEKERMHWGTNRETPIQQTQETEKREGGIKKDKESWREE